MTVAAKGGRPAKSIADHLRDGTYRRDRMAARLESELGGAVESVLDAIGLCPRRRLRAGEPVEVRTDGAHFAEFCRRFCVHTKGSFAGQPFELELWEQAFIDEALSFDDEGRRVYSRVWLLIPRKNGKTTLLAALGLYLASEAEGEAEPAGIIAAGSQEQAGQLFSQAAGFVRRSPSLTREFEVFKTSISAPATDGSLRRVAADGKNNHSLNISNLLGDEIHAWVTPRQVENWHALTTADGAREDAIAVLISTAGWDLRTILGELYQRAHKSPFTTWVPEMGAGGFITRDPEHGELVYCYATGEKASLDDLDDFAAANPGSWRTRERLRQDLARREPDEPTKRRLFGNQWTSARERWISTEAWNAAHVAGLEPAEGDEVWIGLDGALTGDTTAAAVAWRTPDGRVGLMTRVWTAREEVAHDVFVPGGRIDLTLVETWLTEAVAPVYDVSLVGYDPRFLEDLAQRLSEAGFVVADIVQSSGPMSDAYQFFYDGLIRDRTIVHGGDPTFDAHVAAAAGVMTERGWKVSKLKSSSPIDACVASVMAHYLAVTDDGSSGDYVLDPRVGVAA